MCELQRGRKLFEDCRDLFREMTGGELIEKWDELTAEERGRWEELFDEKEKKRLEPS